MNTPKNPLKELIKKLQRRIDMYEMKRINGPMRDKQRWGAKARATKEALFDVKFELAKINQQ